MSNFKLQPLKCQNILAQHARSCITLTPIFPNYEVPSNRLSERSFFGGAPLLPPDFVWPRANFSLETNGTTVQVPLVFCLQLDLSEIAPLDERHELPDHGILAFFSIGESFNFEEPEQCFVVRYFEHYDQLISHQRPEVDGVNSQEQNLELPQLYLSAQAAWSFPYEALSYDAGKADAQLAPWGLSQQVLDEIYDNFEELSAELFERDSIDLDYRIQLLGYAQFIQDPTQPTNCTLLLQLSSLLDPKKERWYGCYGDAGTLYFFVKTEDLKNRNFAQVTGDAQCY